MKLNKIRSILYLLGRVLGDIQAVRSGNPRKMARRVGRRAAGKVTGRLLRRLFK